MINNLEYKTCNICGLIKKHVDFYNTDTRCKNCKCEYQKKRRLINKENKILKIKFYQICVTIMKIKLKH